MKLTVTNKFTVQDFHAHQSIMIIVVDLGEMTAAGPIVVGIGCGKKSLKALELLSGDSGLSAEFLKQCLVQEKSFRGFGNRQHQQTGIKVPFLQELLLEGGQFRFGEIGVPVQQTVCPHNLSSPGIGCEEIRKFLGTRFSIGGSDQCFVDGRGTGHRYHIDGDAVFFAHGVIEFVDGSVQGRLGLAAVYMPNRQGDRIF